MKLISRLARSLAPDGDAGSLVKVKGKWKYLDRAVDSNGNTLEFMFSAKRDKKAAYRFLKKALKAKQNKEPRVINVDKNPAYPPAIEELKKEGILSNECELRQKKYLNNIIEQDHRFPKKLAKYVTAHRNKRVLLRIG